MNVELDSSSSSSPNGDSGGVRPEMPLGGVKIRLRDVGVNTPAPVLKKGDLHGPPARFRPIIG